MQDKPFQIGLAGFGVVGTGLCRLLVDNADIIRRRAGREIVIKTILVRDARKKREIPVPPGVKLTTNPNDLTDDPSLDAIVELMGGIEAPKKLIINALKHGKHVVTANKALLAEDGLQLFKLAHEQKRILRYEASVAGAIPIISVIKESLCGSRVKSVMGILNGTSNYILSEMTSNNVDFAVALRQAQDLGFAEADPSLDIDGMDAAHKLVVLIRLAFGLDYPFAKLAVKGIRGLAAMDIRLAREFGYRIKLIGMVRAQSSNQDLQLAAGVFPALVHHTLLLARVGGSYNAIRVSTNSAGSLFFHGRGAGSLPTGGAVLADLIAVARDENPNNIGYADETLPEASILPYEDWRSCYYARVMVNDEPGVLRDICGCMATEGVSVAQMIQKAECGASGVPLVFMTHETSEKAIRNAFKHAMDANLLRDAPVYFRVLEKEK